MTCRPLIRVRVRALVLCTLVALVPAQALAQRQAGEDRNGRAGRPLPPAAGVTPGELQTMFDGYVLMQAQETLRLSDEQFPRFIARLKTLQEARRRAQVQRARVIAELRRMTQPNAATDEAQLRQQMSVLESLEAKAAAEIKQAATALDEVLDARQQARFRVFEEAMEQRKVELLMRARQSNRQQNRF